MEGEEAKPTGKNPMLAAGLSFMFPGWGQVYTKQLPKGIVLLTLVIMLPIAGIFLTGEGSILGMAIGSALSLALWLYSIYDAYSAAKSMNEGESK